MRNIFAIPCAVCLFAGTVDFVRGDAPSDLLQVIDRAIKATGGEKKLARWKAATWKNKGTFHGLGVPVAYTGEWAVQVPDRSRVVLEFEFMGQKNVFTVVYAGNKGWIKRNDMEQEMDKERLAEQREGMNYNLATKLVPLKGKEYTLSSLGEIKVDNRAAVGVKAARKGYRDVNLYFDKATGLLAKGETRVKADQLSQEVNQEMLYSGYKDIDGVEVPLKVTIKRDGKLYVEGESSDWKPAEKLDDSVFAKP
jgi:hypothetical protein